jgi:hypothetical protein
MTNSRKTITTVVAIAAFGFGMAAITAYTNAYAQSVRTTSMKDGTGLCPNDYRPGSANQPNSPNRRLCYHRRDLEKANAASGSSSSSSSDSGSDTQLTTSARGTIAKPRRNDRCPIGYFTNNEAPMTCITQYETAPSVRLKGAGSCRAGEVEDWGLYCVSDYARLTRDDAGAAGTRDWNDISATNQMQPPNQADVMGDSDYTPAYITIFGRVKRDGSPIGGTAAAAPAAAPARAAAPLPRDTRVGSLSPQRRTATTFGICPAHWYAGQEDSNLPDPNTCYPSQMATPIFPVASQEAPCPENYRNMVSWCVAANRNMPTTQAAAQSSAQTPANCPAPSSGGASQVGAALGGLLGGRRGNSQAASALGGLLGAAAGQAAKPAGCP